MPVLGVPCIDFSLLHLREAGVREVIVNVHAHAAQLIAYLESQPIDGLNISISDESALLLGSAGGFRKALPFFKGEPFFAMNADVIVAVDLEALAKRHMELNADLGPSSREIWITRTLVHGKTLEAQEGSYHEIFVNEKEGLVTGIGAKKNKTPFYPGCAVFDPRCFEHLPLDRPTEFVPDVLEPLIPQRKVAFTWYDGVFFDVGSPELWWQAHFDLKRLYEANQLPAVWSDAIRKKIGKVYVDEINGVVDYDLLQEEDALVLGKNYIRMETVEYAISNLGHNP